MFREWETKTEKFRGFIAKGLRKKAIQKNEVDAGDAESTSWVNVPGGHR
jgi:hypothetical protein